MGVELPCKSHNERGERFLSADLFFDATRRISHKILLLLRAKGSPTFLFSLLSRFHFMPNQTSFKSAWDGISFSHVLRSHIPTVCEKLTSCILQKVSNHHVFIPPTGIRCLACGDSFGILCSLVGGSFSTPLPPSGLEKSGDNAAVCPNEFPPPR